jgi:hypothetical protein
MGTNILEKYTAAIFKRETGERRYLIHKMITSGFI